jgi:hypothetical protein
MFRTQRHLDLKALSPLSGPTLMPRAFGYVAGGEEGNGPPPR